jgi:hypothetical protein
MLMLYLTRADNEEGVYLQLPASPGEIGEVWCRLDDINGDIESTQIVRVISDVRNIGQYIKNADVNDSEQMKKLNRIAEIIDTLGRGEYRLLEGALDAESVNDLDDVISIIKRLDRYLYIPHAANDRELGICLVIHGVKPFDESVRPYLDYTRIGSEHYADHGGAYTAGGYVIRRDNIEPALIDAVEFREPQVIDDMKMG